ncbi:MAG: hypothetical protein WC985_08785 [Thermoplasmata archaeon]
MARLETHLEKARRFQEGAAQAPSPEIQVEAWFLGAYHLIEACAAKHRIHIQKHQRVPAELKRNPVIFGGRTDDVSEAFQYLDHEARAKFVYGGSGTEADLKRVQAAFEAIRSICEEVLG